METCRLAGNNQFLGSHVLCATAAMSDESAHLAGVVLGHWARPFITVDQQIAVFCLPCKQSLPTGQWVAHQQNKKHRRLVSAANVPSQWQPEEELFPQVPVEPEAEHEPWRS